MLFILYNLFKFPLFFFMFLFSPHISLLLFHICNAFISFDIFIRSIFISLTSYTISSLDMFCNTLKRYFFAHTFYGCCFVSPSSLQQYWLLYQATKSHTPVQLSIHKLKKYASGKPQLPSLRNQIQGSVISSCMKELHRLWFPLKGHSQGEQGSVGWEIPDIN